MRFSLLSQQEKKKEDVIRPVSSPDANLPLTFASSSSLFSSSSSSTELSRPSSIQLEIDAQLSLLLQSRKAAEENASLSISEQKSSSHLEEQYNIAKQMNASSSSSSVPVTFVQLEKSTGINQSQVPLTSKEW
jgi:hypothetical protein